MKLLSLLSDFGMILVGLLAIIYWKIKTRRSFIFFFLGAATWLVAVVAKSLAAIPLPLVIKTFKAHLPAYIAHPALWIIVGLYTGIFECGLALVAVYAIRKLRKADAEEAVGFGVGFGAFEAIMLGMASSIVTLIILLTPPNQLPQVLSEAASKLESTTWWVLPVPVVERTIALFIHIFSSMLIIYAVQQREWKWFWYSFFYKSLVDAIAAVIHVTIGSKNLTPAILWLFELLLLPLGVAGYFGMKWLLKKWGQIRFSQNSQQIS